MFYAIIGMFLVALLWPILLLVKLFEKPAIIEPKEVMEYLDRMARGEIDDYWWDDFLNVPIQDPRLDTIRQECENVWHPDNGYLAKAEGGDEMDYFLNKKGVAKVENLKDICAAIMQLKPSST